MLVTAILAGASIPNYSWLSKEISSYDCIICVDSGLRHAHNIQITPNIIIGDFDSVDTELLNDYKGKSEIFHDLDQNNTDLLKAINKVSSNHDIHIYGAVGERADHDFSNYITLLNHNKCDQIILKTEFDSRRIIKKPISFKANIGDVVGVFPLLPIDNLSYLGLKWSASDLNKPFVLGWNGACNVVTSRQVEINIDSGAALITHTRIL